MSRVWSSYALGSDLVRRQRAYTKEDWAKTKLLFRILFLVAFVAILSLFYIWSRVQVVQYGYTMNVLASEQAQLQEENKKIKVILAALKAPQHLSEIASQKLHMQTLKPEQLRVLPEILPKTSSELEGKRPMKGDGNG